MTRRQAIGAIVATPGAIGILASMGYWSEPSSTLGGFFKTIIVASCVVWCVLIGVYIAFGKKG